MCTCVQIHVEARGLPCVSFPKCHPHLSLLRQGLSLAWGSPNKLSCLASNPRGHLSLPPKLWNSISLGDLMGIQGFKTSTLPPKPQSPKAWSLNHTNHFNQDTTEGGRDRKREGGYREVVFVIIKDKKSNDPCTCHSMASQCRSG